MYIILAISLGGAIGAIFRHVLSNVIQSFSTNNFPYGILICNIIGSIILGLLYDNISKTDYFSDSIKAFIQIGVLGSFTTFSAFSLEAFLMIERADYISAIVLILLSVFLSIGGLILGIYFTRLVF
jgi:fluoride exporter|tara:strand:+ start:414 stop:791 length:378 start_codon:yes stop_codon:yes gene_type:complete